MKTKYISIAKANMAGLDFRPKKKLKQEIIFQMK